ncbi:MAG: AI-2E family transporter [Lachnospiraceae bacterium]|nr:AI-2E family transporter [Lachnospiraceae bacterium]MBR5179241.1 AI-2E family transporter [Lachnospiraceae bacterium]
MSLNPFSKKKKKKQGVEKGHREPIVVKFFKEKDPEKHLKVSIDESADEKKADVSEDKTADTAEGQKHARFVPNDKYFTITIYAFTALVALILFAVIISNITPVMEAIKHFLHVLIPFIVGGIIAFVLTPIVNFLDEALFEKCFKIKKPKLRAGLSITLTYVVFLGLIVLALIKLIPEMADSVTELIGKSKSLYGTVMNNLNNLADKFPDIDFSNIIDKAKENLPTILSNVGDILKVSLPKIFSTSYSIVQLLINILLAVAVSIYMVCDKRRIGMAATKLVYALLKPEKAEKLIENAKESFQIFTGFIIGKSIDSLIIGILTFFILTVFQLKYSLLVAVIVGVTNMIPFFGPFIGAIPGVLLYLCIEPVDALIFVGIILAIQQFDGWILGPMILGDSTGVRPIWVIFGITVGGAYFGFAGMFLGVPFTAVIVYLVNKAVDKKLSDKHIEVQ